MRNVMSHIWYETKYIRIRVYLKCILVLGGVLMLKYNHKYCCAYRRSKSTLEMDNQWKQASLTATQPTYSLFNTLPVVTGGRGLAVNELL